jgi:hypothetical protein
MEAVAKIDEDLDLDLHEVNLLTVWNGRKDWESLSREAIDVKDVFGDGKGEYFLDPNRDRRFITQYAGLLMERTFGMVEAVRLDAQRRRYRMHLLIEGQSFQRLESTFEVDLDAPSSPGLRITPAPLNFGAAPRGSVQTRTLTIENVAGARVEISAPASQSGSPFRWQAFNAALEHGERRTVAIEFRPQSSAIVRASLVITSTAPESPHGISLMGKGSGGLPTDPPPPPPRLNIKPALIMFGSVEVGKTVQRTFSIENATGNSVTITIPAPPGASPFGWQAFSGPLAAGAQRSFTVTFRPAAKTIATGSIRITSSAPGGPHSVSLAGKGGIGGFPTPPPDVP